MASILVVCTGNVCRSPMAEGFLRNALRARLGDGAPPVSSAGIGAWVGSGATPEAVQAAGERGSDIGGHVARLATPDLVEQSSLVLCMAREHRVAVSREAQSAVDRTFTLKELVRLLEHLPGQAEASSDGLPARVREAAEARAHGFAGNPDDEDISDPLGQPLDDYRAIAWELDGWIARLVAGLYGGTDR
jgi:low molecular weight protein-tyrosine phosphatase